MSNFKSGSGDLDFGGEDNEGATNGSQESPDDGNQDEIVTSGESKSMDEETDTESIRSKYPYFIRRNNVGDERDTRLEIHVRDKVAEQEGSFRNDVAEELGVSEISKTDAREFALLAAFEHPEKVAKLMEDEGFGTIG